jgi:hypothetical protein
MVFAVGQALIFFKTILGLVQGNIRHVFDKMPQDWLPFGTGFLFSSFFLGQLALSAVILKRVSTMHLILHIIQ